MEKLEKKLFSKSVKLIAKTAIGVAVGTYLLGIVVGNTFVKNSLNQEKAEKIINYYENQNVLLKIPMFGSYLASKDYIGEFYNKNHKSNHIQ